MRVMLNELTRINSHLVWLGTHAMDIGAMTVFLYCFREREDMLRMFEMVSGQRMMTSYFRIGGLALEPPLGFFERVQDFADALPCQGRRIRESADRKSHLGHAHQGRGADHRGRCDRAGSQRADTARQRRRFRSAARHAVLRLRELQVQGAGIAATATSSRVTSCRVAEMRESIAMVQQALDGMPEGPIKADAPKVVLPDREKMKTQMEALIYHFKIVTEGFAVPAGEVYQAVESPRGEMGYYIVSDGTAKPYRVHMRSACLANLQTLPTMCEGRLLADVVAAIGSIDIVLGEIDR